MDYFNHLVRCILVLKVDRINYRGVLDGREEFFVHQLTASNSKENV